MWREEVAVAVWMESRVLFDQLSLGFKYPVAMVGRQLDIKI